MKTAEIQERDADLQRLRAVALKKAAKEEADRKREEATARWRALPWTTRWAFTLVFGLVFLTVALAVIVFAGLGLNSAWVWLRDTMSHGLCVAIGAKC